MITTYIFLSYPLLTSPHGRINHGRWTISRVNSLYKTKIELFSVRFFLGLHRRCRSHRYSKYATLFFYSRLSECLIPISIHVYPPTTSSHYDAPASITSTRNLASGCEIRISSFAFSTCSSKMEAGQKEIQPLIINTASDGVGDVTSIEQPQDSITSDTSRNVRA